MKKILVLLTLLSLTACGSDELNKRLGKSKSADTIGANDDGLGIVSSSSQRFVIKGRVEKINGKFENDSDNQGTFYQVSRNQPNSYKLAEKPDYVDMVFAVKRPGEYRLDSRAIGKGDVSNSFILGFKNPQEGRNELLVWDTFYKSFSNTVRVRTDPDSWKKHRNVVLVFTKPQAFKIRVFHRESGTKLYSLSLVNID